MRGIINAVAFVLTVIFISWKTKRPLATSVPSAWSLLMLVLLPLSWLRAMWLIDVLSLVVCIIVPIYFYQLSSKDGAFSLGNLIFQSSTALLLALTAAAIIINRHSTVTAWDDISYWAASVRSLYERFGLEAKNCAVAPGWGDYPLGQQYVEWWFMHSFSSKWSENLLYIAFYSMMFSILLSVFSHFRHKNPAVLGASLFLIFLLLMFSWHSLFADLLMAAMFACCVVYIYSYVSGAFDSESNRWDLLAIGIQLTAVALIKSIGILWSMSAIALFLVLKVSQLMEEGHTLRKSLTLLSIHELILVSAPTLTAFSLWQVICEILNRSTYLVGNVAHAQLMSPEWYMERSKAFFNQLFVHPWIQLRLFSLNIELPYALFLFAPCLLMIFCCKGSKKRLACVSLVYTAGLTCGYMLILLVSYFTMFSYEPAAVKAFLRYLLPSLLVNWASLIFLLSVEREKARIGQFAALLLSLLVFVCCGAQLFSGRLENNANTALEYAQTRQAYEKRFGAFYTQLEKLSDPLNASIFYFEAGLEEYDRIHLCFLGQGTAIRYNSDPHPDSVENTIKSGTATHLIVYPRDTLIPDDYQHFMSTGEIFEFGKLYEVKIQADGTYVLK